MNRKRILVICLLLASLLLSGCNFDTGRLFKSATGQDEQPLIKAQIVFTDGKTLVTYLKDLGIEDTGKVYVGGASSTNLYDAKGNIIGAFNYQRVLYIKILPPKSNAAGSAN